VTRRPTDSARARAALAAASLALVALAAGCLGTPKVEDGWTRLDLDEATFTPAQPLAPGAPCSVSVRTSVTYRRIVTGFLVTELRAATPNAPSGFFVAPDAPRLRMAQDIDVLLANSVSVGRAVRAVTGWDHLIQRFDLSFSAWTPGSIDTNGVPAGAPSGFFLVSYLGSGEEIELEDGSDSIAVTPFVSTEAEILPVGMPVVVGAGSVP
jgi:hypothetical protein